MSARIKVWVAVNYRMTTTSRTRLYGNSMGIERMKTFNPCLALRYFPLSFDFRQPNKSSSPLLQIVVINSPMGSRSPKPQPEDTLPCGIRGTTSALPHSITEDHLSAPRIVLRIASLSSDNP